MSMRGGQRSLNEILDNIYPIGSIYLSTNSTNPSNYFGGVWEQIKDRFLLACGDTYKIGATGGEATHKLTISEMPSHTHKYRLAYGNTDPAQGFAYGNTSSGTFSGDFIQNMGENQAHNNMPPYLAIYVWTRIS